MTNVAPTNRKINPLTAFYAGILKATESDWPKDDDQNTYGSPFAFCWADDQFRDQIISWLLHSAGKRQTDYAGREVLRYLMFRFRVAQHRKRASGMSADFRGHRWVWATHAEVSRLTCVSEQSVQRAIRELERRGLIHQVYDYALNNVPHYRPSADLFRLCRQVTLPWDKKCIKAQCEGAKAAEYESLLDHWANAHVLLVNTFHDDLRALVRAFGQENTPGRMKTFADGFNSLLERASDLADANE
ncbi:hypothetical protein [Pseudotabrizicola alkalilacus]|uniref:hypothetical protein n=1 Tax=Pseudotabrizicola alkalilacus TaxID=2305252 RepID=UPI001313E7DE|nr:hypothetical protein [Pseudotabrizicola alkalilacus]